MEDLEIFSFQDDEVSSDENDALNEFCTCTNPLKNYVVVNPKFPQTYLQLAAYLHQMKETIDYIESILQFNNSVDWLHKSHESSVNCSSCWYRRMRYRELLKQKKKNFRRMEAAFYLFYNKKHVFQEDLAAAHNPDFFKPGSV